MKTNGFNAETQRTQSNAEANFSLWPAAAGAQRSARPTPQPSTSCRGEAQRRLVSLQPSAFSLQPSRQGVALIITLILLSVVTFMAVTFLALSRRERGAVATVTDTAGARYAADAALANAEAQIIANALSTTNPYNFGLLVSTNTSVPVDFTDAAGKPDQFDFLLSRERRFSFPPTTSVRTISVFISTSTATASLTPTAFSLSSVRTRSILITITIQPIRPIPRMAKRCPNLWTG